METIGIIIIGLLELVRIAIIGRSTTTYRIESQLMYAPLQRIVARISNRKNVFIFGAPDAGKSTMLASLIRYISNNAFYEYRRDPVANPDGVKVIRAMNEAAERGGFPDKTLPDVCSEVKIQYRRRDKSDTQCFFFQEIPGEKVVRFDPVNEEHKQIDGCTQDFFLSSVGAIIVASSQPEYHKEKEAINDFLEWLYRTKYNRPILFLLTKYDLISNSFNNEVQAANAIYRNSIGLLACDNTSTVLPFSVGTVEDDKITQNQINDFVPPLIKWLESL